jgi:hypothetical protein
LRVAGAKDHCLTVAMTTSSMGWPRPFMSFRSEILPCSSMTASRMTSLLVPWGRLERLGLG